MEERLIAADSVIYREGDAADAVFIVHAGKVDISRETEGETVSLANLGPGAIFGEMGVLRDRPRSTTVRAMDETTILVLPKAEFLDAFGGENSLALTLVRMLCARLSQADDEIVQHKISAGEVRLDRIGAIRLEPASPEVEPHIGRDGIEIADLPFRIGRHALADRRTSVSASSLTLRAPRSLQVALQHLSIEAGDGGLIVRDLGSHLGTMVNGIRAAHFEQSDECALHFGKNHLQLGGQDSPYRFWVTVERAGQDEDA